MSASEHPRPIRSFVTRAGRITAGQERALSELWPKYGIDATAAVPDGAARFGREAPLSIEIGFGNGENLLALALEELSVTNVRVICRDAVEVLAQQVPSQAAQEILILFPDPWPKKRHHKRRLIQPAFAELAVSRLCRGGVLRLATDWAPYAQEMLAVLGAIPALENLAADAAFVPRPAGRAPTRFEKRGLRLGHEVWDLAFRRA
jgi:tRNA (guanine-N7-)-methyltransferase